MREDDVRGLFNHDPNQILGRTKPGTMRLEVDERGLRYEIDPADTTPGRDVKEHLKRGDVDGSSFSFVVTDERTIKEDGKRIREIRGVKLFDVGPVTFPAYPATSAQVRSGLREEFDALEAEPTEPDREAEAASRFRIQARARAIATDRM